jgi:hypothetical protein
MNTENTQIETLDLTQLDQVTGGGWIGTAFKAAKKAAPFVKQAAPWVGHKAVEAAKWTGIPTAVGVGASWVKHQFDR